MFNTNEYTLISDTHTHTTFSDGKGSIEDNVKAAIAMGLKEIAITDHCFNHFLYGIKKGDLEKEYNEIQRLREIYSKDIKILFGIEANLISFDGDIDLTQEQCKMFDIINLGVHRAIKYKKASEFFTLFLRNYFKSTKKHREKLTQAYIKAIQKYPITTIAHLHNAQRVNVKDIATVASQKGILIELNNKRVLFNQAEIDDMNKLGCKFIINTDSHNPCDIGKFPNVEAFLNKYDFPLEKIVNLKKKNA